MERGNGEVQFASERDWPVHDNRRATAGGGSDRRVGCGRRGREEDGDGGSAVAAATRRRSVSERSRVTNIIAAVQSGSPIWQSYTTRVEIVLIYCVIYITDKGNAIDIEIDCYVI